MNSISNRIEERIKSWERGRIFFIGDFADLGGSDVVRQSLNRLVKSGLIVRSGRGVYCYPELMDDGMKSLLGVKDEYVMPSVERIAEAIAERDRCRIAPTGDHALNWLGLSTQVPCNVVFLTDGSQRRVPMGGGKGIFFQHTSDMSNFAYQSKLMQLIVLAVKELGEDGLSEGRKAIISGYLKRVDKGDFDSDVKLAPAWVGKELLRMYAVL